MTAERGAFFEMFLLLPPTNKQPDLLSKAILKKCRPYYSVNESERATKNLFYNLSHEKDRVLFLNANEKQSECELRVKKV